MRNLFLTLAMAVSVTFSSWTLAEDKYDGVGIIRGTVISGGRVDPSSHVGTGSYVDVNFSSVMVNIGANSKSFGDSPLNEFREDLQVNPLNPESQAQNRRVNNAYAGVGVGRLIQIQLGYGTRGKVYRVRSDWNFRSIYSALTRDTIPKRRITLADRITFSISAERYSGDNDIFDNGTWGVGLLF